MPNFKFLYIFKLIMFVIFLNLGKQSNYNDKINYFLTKDIKQMKNNF